MADLSLEAGVDLLASRARLLRLLLVAGFATTVIGIAGSGAEVQGLIDLEADEFDSLSGAYSIFLMVEAILLVATVILFCMWIYRSAANVIQAGITSFEYTPGWSVGWYFIPIATLWKPLSAMRQIWNASHAEYQTINDNHNLLNGWWAAWIMSNIFANIGFRLALAGETQFALTFDLLAGVADLALYPLALLLVTKVTAAQQLMRLRGSVFA